MARQSDHVLSLFSGAGGFSHGFAAAGLRPVCGAELSRSACRTYQDNLGADCHRLDLGTVPPRFFRDLLGAAQPFAIIGGPPCQGFSTAGPRHADDPRNRLIFNYLRIVDELRPRWFIFENVEGLLTAAHGRDLAALVREFLAIGYCLRLQKVNLAGHGVPQTRKRVLLVGNRLGADFDFPAERFSYDSGKARKSNGRPFAPSLAQALAGLGRAVATRGERARYCADRPLSGYDAMMRGVGGAGGSAVGDGTAGESGPGGGWPGDSELGDIGLADGMLSRGRRPGDSATGGGQGEPGNVCEHVDATSAEDAARYRLLAPGQSMRHLPRALWHDSFQRRAFRRVADGTPSERRGGAPATLRRLHGDLQSLTITGASSREFIHPDADRCLTRRECARLQSFPDGYRFHGSAASVMRQIGNAVPPLAAAAFARHLSALDGAFGADTQSLWPVAAPRLLGYVLTDSDRKSRALQATDALLGEMMRAR